MSSRTQIRQQQKAATPTLMPLHSGFLQRECVFVGTPGLTGGFTAPRRKPLLSQPSLIQAKLTINRPNDRYEQEANRVVDLLMRMPELQVQRQVKDEEEEELIQTKPLADQITPLVQRQAEEEEEEEPIQAKPLLQKQPSHVLQIHLLTFTEQKENTTCCMERAKANAMSSAYRDMAAEVRRLVGSMSQETSELVCLRMARERFILPGGL